MGLGVFFAVATPLWQPGQPLPLIVAIGVLAGILMAASMAAVSGLVLVRLLGSQPPARTRTDPEQVESARLSAIAGTSVSRITRKRVRAGYGAS